MVPLPRPVIRFLDDPLPRPDNLVTPSHDPIRSAFIPISTGFMLNESKSYLEHLSTTRDFSWMNDDWEYLEDMYSYWPFMENSVGVSPDPYYYAYNPSMVYALIRVSDNSFTIEGVVCLDSPPGLDLAYTLENIHRERGLTRLNMALVPLEMVDVPEETLESVIYYWHNTLLDFDWSVPRFRMDSLVYWSNVYRDRLNDLILQEQEMLEDTDESLSITRRRHFPDAQDMYAVHGMQYKYSTYCDPLGTSSFMADLRSRVPEISAEVTAQDVSYVYRTGRFLHSIGPDPGVYHKLNAILSTYPDEIVDRFLTGVNTSLDPRNTSEIGAGFYVSRKPTWEGRQLLTYEDILQPRP